MVVRDGAPGTPTAGHAARDLARGRQAYARRDHAGAVEALSAADRGASLEGDDLDRLATAAMILGKDDEALKAWGRAHHAYLEAGQKIPAARVATWLGFRLVAGDDKGRGAGWLARAQRLLDEAGEDCVERGYLLLPAARQQLDGRRFEEARAAAAEAARIGERFRESDLVAFARSLEGQALLRQGRIEEGLALLDEAMVAVAAGELSPLVTGLIYCSVIAAARTCTRSAVRASGRTALKAWCEAQPGDVGFTGDCLVHRSEILQLERRVAGTRSKRRGAPPSGFSRASPNAPRRPRSTSRPRSTGCAASSTRPRRRTANASRWGGSRSRGSRCCGSRRGDGDAAAAALRRVLGATTDPLRARASSRPASRSCSRPATSRRRARPSAELEDIGRRLRHGGRSPRWPRTPRGGRARRGRRAQAALEPLRRSFEIWQRLGRPYLAARVRVLVARACRALGDDDGAASSSAPRGRCSRSSAPRRTSRGSTRWRTRSGGDAAARPDAARAPGAAPRRGGQDQQGDRHGALPEREDGRPPRRATSSTSWTCPRGPRRRRSPTSTS